MIALDDRTGNVLTTIAVFVALVIVVVVARATVVVFILALLFAYLLEPIVAAVERFMARVPHVRAVSIGVVYVIGTLLIVVAGRVVGPTIADQVRRAGMALPDIAVRIDSATALGRRERIVGLATRASRVAAAAAEGVAWLLMVPIVAICFLANRTSFLDGAVDLFARRSDRMVARRTVQQIDRVLADYTRAQLILAGLSAIFYGASMAALGFPYPLALGALGGALEFVPVLGWVVASSAMLASGWIAHAHWIWMALLIAVWRLVQNFVVSPRVMGERLQMEPITVLFTMMVGGQLGGLVGVLLSVPAIAVFRIAYQDRASRDMESVLASSKP